MNSMGLNEFLIFNDVIGHDGHIKALHTFGHEFSNAADADNTQVFAMHVEGPLPLPSAIADLAI